MPSMADIVVKKADETTNITYSAKVASSGDKNPAVWKETTTGSAPGFNPMFTLSSTDNGPRTARRLSFSYAYPYTVTGGDGTISVAHRVLLSASLTVPVAIPQATINEAVAQAMNLMASALVKTSCKDGFAPT